MVSISEQRNAKRYRLEMPAEIRIRDSESEAEVSFNLKTKDISSSGVCLDGPSGVEEGTEMEVSLEIPLAKLRNVTSRVAKVQLNGVVVRVSEKGMALSFRDTGDFQYIDSGRRIDQDESGLTAIEKQFLEKIEEGASNRQIAEALQISEKAVSTKLHRVFAKIHVKGRLQAAIWASHNL
jgi:DNA-binding CsgD family transcriptional regulator